MNSFLFPQQCNCATSSVQLATARQKGAVGALILSTDTISTAASQSYDFLRDTATILTSIYWSTVYIWTDYVKWRNMKRHGNLSAKCGTE